VLIVYADSGGAPAVLQSEILAEPGVAAVDLFDAVAGTLTLGQLQQYQIVVPFSNSPFLDAAALGNNLADYVDGGGVVAQAGFSFYGPNQPYGVNGRWVTGNYNPYNYSTALVATAFTLGAYNAGHPLMAGVTAMASNFQNNVTLAAGATQVAAASNGNSLIAFRPVGVHTTVGITGYLGSQSIQSGDWGRVIVNAGRWLLPCVRRRRPPPRRASPHRHADRDRDGHAGPPTATDTPLRPPPPTHRFRPPPPRPRPGGRRGHRRDRARAATAARCVAAGRRRIRGSGRAER
jgi:hypothetical protein